MIFTVLAVTGLAWSTETRN